MATRKKVRNTGLGLKATQKALMIASAIGTDFAIKQINKMEFMNPETGAEPATFEVKKVVLTGGLMLGGLAGSVMTKNPYLEAVADGVASAAGINASDVAQKGLSGLGADNVANSYESLYDTDHSEVKGIEDAQIGAINNLDIQ